MSKRNKRFLIFLFCAAFVSNFGCATTKDRVGPSKAERDDYEIGRNTAIINWYVENEPPRFDPNKKPRICTIAATVAGAIVNPATVGWAIARHVAKKKSSRATSE